MTPKTRTTKAFPEVLSAATQRYYERERQTATLSRFPAAAAKADSAPTSSANFMSACALGFGDERR
jgi:hypothetical protein